MLAQELTETATRCVQGGTNSWSGVGVTCPRTKGTVFTSATYSSTTKWITVFMMWDVTPAVFQAEDPVW